MTVTFYGRLAGTTIPGEDFTIIAIPDTQHYVDNPANEDNFAAQTQWIVDNKDPRNIVFISGLGDIVQNGDSNDSEWQIADAAYSLIEDPATTLLTDGIPYGLSVGNHDQSPIGGGSSASTTKYNQYFGISRFAGRNYYGGHYGSDNDNNYELFSAGGMDFIAIHFEYDTTPEQDVLDWADNLLTTYSNRRATVSTHYLIGLGNPASFGTQGQAIYNALSDHENLFLMLAGHIHGEGRRQDTAVNGNIVNTLLSDYQDYPNGGNGFLRIMTFSPANDTIQVRTYSPTLDEFETDDSSQFTLSYDMDGGDPFQVIGTVNESSGSNASVPWPGLDDNTEYEWFVTVDDGNNVATGPIWSFTTGTTNPGDVPPDTTLTATPSDPSNSDSASFEFTGTDNLTDPASLTFECQLDSSGFSACTSPTSYTSLADGSHTFEVRAIDEDNNTDPTPASFTWTIDTSPPTTTFQVRVNQSSDDAEERDSDSVMNLTSTDLEMVHDSLEASGVDQLVGMRFQNVVIPPNVTIESAYIEFETDETSSEATALTIFGQATDDPTTFVGSISDISSRPRTTASAAWNPGAWNTVSEKHQTNDLSLIVQEIVNRGGWVSGNAMAIIVEGSGQRVAESYDGEPDNAPLLVIEYSESTGDPNPAIEVQKTPASQTIVSGEDAIFNITVENTGDVDLTDIDVDDAQCDSLIQDNDGNGDAVLDVGESWTYTCTVDDVSADFTNSATATGTPPIGDDVSDTDTADVTVLIPDSYYNIMATAGMHGSITPSGLVTVLEGDDRSFSITPDTGYQVADVLIDGVSAGAVLSYTFDIVQANHTIEAFFEEIPSAEYNAMIFLPLIMK